LRTLNEVRLLGHLGKDAETRYTGGGTPVTNFSLATERRVKQGDEWKSETDWHNVVLWKGENVAGFLTKGKAVLVCGRLQTRSWEDRDGNKRYSTEVVCDAGGLILCGGGTTGSADDSGGPGGRDSRPNSSRQMDSGEQAVADDDVPF
jgi:single-strand DNA-binding protein